MVQSIGSEEIQQPWAELRVIDCVGMWALTVRTIVLYDDKPKKPSQHPTTNAIYEMPKFRSSEIYKYA